MGAKSSKAETSVQQEAARKAKEEQELRNFEKQKTQVIKKNEQNKNDKEAVMERNDMVMQERKRMAEEAVKQAAYQLNAAKQEKLSEDEGEGNSEQTAAPMMLRRQQTSE